MFGAKLVGSSFRSSVEFRTPASASVETTGLSAISTCGAVPCCAASNLLVVRSDVSKPVPFTVTPALLPQLSSSFTQSEELSNWGYGSQTVNVPPVGAADELLDEDELPDADELPLEEESAAVEELGAAADDAEATLEVAVDVVPAAGVDDEQAASEPATVR